MSNKPSLTYQKTFAQVTLICEHQSLESLSSKAPSSIPFYLFPVSKMRLLAPLTSALLAYNGVLAAAVPTMVEERHVEERLVGPAVTISKPTATIVGRTVPYADVNPIAAGSLESFKQIPFAQPPVGSLRLKPPVALDATKNLGTIDATVLAAKACPQQIMSEQ